MRYTLALVLSLLVLGAANPWALGADRAPNIVLIYADDLGWGDVGFNGRTEWRTPNLDRLGARGTVFQRFYTAAVVCSPSRAALMTGKYTIHNGVIGNGEDLSSREVTIAEALKARGYATAMFGKWHHGKPRKGEEPPAPKSGEPTAYVHPLDQGFDEFFGFTDATHAWEKFPKILWDGRRRVEVTGYADDLFTDRAVEFVGRQRETPFFLYVPYIAVHFQIAAPADEVALHRGKFPETDASKPRNATYAAMVTRLDKNVGRIVAALEEQGLTDNTLIVFTSDHGATFEQGNQGTSAALDSNRPFRGQKRTLWEGGIRVPGLACWPGHIPAGVVSPSIVHMTDLFPTFLAVAGGSPDPAWHVDGINQLPVWLGHSPAPERTLFWEWRSEGANQLAALRGDFKLVVNRGGKSELYNVATDPAERRDLASTDPKLAQQLQKALLDWLATEIQP
jgi:arylsulfatase A-like enzyme